MSTGQPSRSYRDLIVWQKSMGLVQRIYTCTRSFPRDETYGVTSQLRRAGVSLAANIAEGQARNSIGEFLQFLGIARGSLAELETLIMICEPLGYIPSPIANGLLSDCEEIQRLLAALMQSLKTKN
jgi:four helix bundle protein